MGAETFSPTDNLPNDNLSSATATMHPLVPIEITTGIWLATKIELKGVTINVRKVIFPNALAFVRPMNSEGRYSRVS